MTGFARCSRRASCQNRVAVRSTADQDGRERARGDLRTAYPGDVGDGAVRDLERDSGVEPLRTNDRTTVLVGCGLWAVLLVLSVLNRESLERDGTGWWLWTCVAGLVLGAVGLVGLQLRHRRLVARGELPPS